MSLETEKIFMEAAIAEARKSRSEGGIPIGSVLVRANEIVAAGHNRRVQDNDPVTHAEIDCLRRAGRLGSFHDTSLYSTLMPCYLCPERLFNSGLKDVIVGEAAPFPAPPISCVRAASKSPISTCSNVSR